MIGLDFLGIVAGLLPAGVALHHIITRRDAARWRSAAFWAAFAVTLAIGPWLPDLVNGLLVLGMVALAAMGLKPQPVASSDEAHKLRSAARLGWRLLLPALCIPTITLAGTLLMPDGRLAGRPIIDPKQVTLVWLAVATLISIGFAAGLTRAPRSAPAAEARRLSDTIGWAMALPQMLAALGGIFALAGVGKMVATGITSTLPLDARFMAVIAYCVGMALFTIIMGNAFAAFPIMTVGIAIPILIHQFGGNPPTIVALGMLSGFCGTLLTPMAANFNIVPAALLELRDRHGVIRAQAPTAFIILCFNIIAMAWCAFP
ncbi:DUF979 domain-containing protein [Sphingobium rhizovicinum]|uniref:DUF979 domain-containing protein n=1 Tax=Sphingobium rhizovicinum TaxID=432308 RepID=A0ABV7NL81_9SPHN